VSHELRTPLNAIIGFSEIMTQELFGPLGAASYKGYVSDILASGHHLLALINDVLDMSKIEAGKMTLHRERLDMGPLAEEALRLVRNRAETSGLMLIADIGEDLPEVEADARAVKQILLNLLSNAVKFTPAGGRVSVRARAEAGGVRLTVHDTGIGIDPDDLPRLAAPFEQVESQQSKTTQGTGLGLALSKAFVEMHGSNLTIESAPGHGTLVSFLLLAPRQGAPSRRALAARLDEIGPDRFALDPQEGPKGQPLAFRQVTSDDDQGIAAWGPGKADTRRWRISAEASRTEGRDLRRPACGVGGPRGLGDDRRGGWRRRRSERF